MLILYCPVYLRYSTGAGPMPGQLGNVRLEGPGHHAPGRPQVLLTDLGGRGVTSYVRGVDFTSPFSRPIVIPIFCRTNVSS